MWCLTRQTRGESQQNIEEDLCIDGLKLNYPEDLCAASLMHYNVLMHVREMWMFIEAVQIDTLPPWNDFILSASCLNIASCDAYDHALRNKYTYDTFIY